MGAAQQRLLQMFRDVVAVIRSPALLVGAQVWTASVDVKCERNERASLQLDASCGDGV